MCSHCGARHFDKETGGRMCCMDGKVVLPRIKKPTEPFLRLLFTEDVEGRTFKKYIRSFNNGLCLSSLQYNQRQFRAGHFKPIVIEGSVHQFLGPLIEKEAETPRFAQLWLHDPAMETTKRVQNMNLPADISRSEEDAVRKIIEDLQVELKRINPYIKDFRQIVDIPAEQLQGGKLVISAKARPAGEHARRYNVSTNLQEVSILTDCRPHDLVVTTHEGKLEHVSEQNRAYQPLHFTLLCPWGDEGWHPDLRSAATGKRITTREFAVYHMALRDEALTYEQALIQGAVDFIHRLRRLWQEWLCTMWLITQNMRLNYQDQNQKALRADTYRNVKRIVDTRRLSLATRGDELYRDDHSLRVGVKILSRSFVGSPRYYHMQFLDAMAIVRVLGKPDYFITMTCNPRWPEITAELREGQSPEDRPEVTARVFRQKLTALLDTLNKGAVFGSVKAHCATVEFQKRGLPHAHILLIVDEMDRLTTPEQVDNVISAELPPDPETADNDADKEQMRRLEKIVLTNMIHGPCGQLNPKAPCMEEAKCTKKFPKPYQKYTTVDAVSSFPTYRRRSPEDGGRVITLTRGGFTFQVTNADVVPYSPMLSLLFNCHINVEKSNSPKNAKYLYKYITKGPDRAMVSVELDDEERPRNEIQEFKDLR